MMTRREFVGWMLASVAAIVAGSRVWRLFRQLAERGEVIPLTITRGYGSHLIRDFRAGDFIAVTGGDGAHAVGRVTAIDTRGAITVTWG